MLSFWFFRDEFELTLSWFESTAFSFSNLNYYQSLKCGRLDGCALTIKWRYSFSIDTEQASSSVLLGGARKQRTFICLGKGTRIFKALVNHVCGQRPNDVRSLNGRTSQVQPQKSCNFIAMEHFIYPAVLLMMGKMAIMCIWILNSTQRVFLAFIPNLRQSSPQRFKFL